MRIQPQGAAARSELQRNDTTDPYFVQLFVGARNNRRPSPKFVAIDALPIRKMLPAWQEPPDAPRCMFGGSDGGSVGREGVSCLRSCRSLPWLPRPVIVTMPARQFHPEDPDCQAGSRGALRPYGPGSQAVVRQVPAWRRRPSTDCWRRTRGPENSAGPRSIPSTAISWWLMRPVWSMFC